jgi:DNA-binding GntR family transcriptional regulator
MAEQDVAAGRRNMGPARAGRAHRDGVTLNHRVSGALRESFMQGEFVPGQKLTLRDLARVLGTSMTPVREAIGRLAALGVLTVHPKRYIEVEVLSAETYTDIVGIRKLLEGHAAALAARRATHGEIAPIRRINRAVAAFARSGKLRQAMKENQRFHFSIYATARSPALLEAIENLWLRVGPSLNQVLAVSFASDARSLLEGFENHGEVIRALTARNARRARLAITEDIEVSARYLLSGLRA